jgi:serine/threonine-protein kinase HipA
LATRIVGRHIFSEMLRRLTFMVASGNNDAHRKNWSLLYPGAGIQAQLSPLYDQVFTAQWDPFSKELALKLGGTKAFAAMTLDRFRELAQRLGESPKDAVGVVEQTIVELAAKWTELRRHPVVSTEYLEALRRHWQKVPLLQPYAREI